jgi:hypothetical protein
MGKNRYILWLGVLGFLFVVAPVLALPVHPPQNQCTGDCSPCLGAGDPFCNQSDPPIPTTPQNCLICKNQPIAGRLQLGCTGVEEGEIGTTGCRTVTNGTTVVSCEGIDEACEFISVH